MSDLLITWLHTQWLILLLPEGNQQQSTEAHAQSVGCGGNEANDC